MTVVAVATILGLGTFGLLHLYEDTAVGHTDQCITCRVVGSSPTLTTAPPSLSAPIIVSMTLVTESVPSLTAPLVSGTSARGPPYIS